MAHAAPEAAEAATAAPRRIADTPHARLRGDARGSNGGIRKELAAGMTTALPRRTQESRLAVD
jgi:hypothetical protein